LQRNHGARRLYGKRSGVAIAARGPQTGAAASTGAIHIKEYCMKATLALTILGLSLAGQAAADPLVPFASHRAAYTISLVKGDGAQAPVAATGMIAYEFRGSACDGYASDFRQVTELQRNEGDPMASDTRAIMFEDAQAKKMRFKIDSTVAETSQPTIDGSATHGDGGDLSVDLKAPKQETLHLGKDVLFPTQHLFHVIEAAKEGEGTLAARVYDGSDTGEKIFDTLTVIGKQASSLSADLAKAEALKSVRRWPVTISYFDTAKKDGAPDYILSFDLYENGVLGSLKLDYGQFVLVAQLSKFELLQSEPCTQ
jgi:EipB-like